MGFRDYSPGLNRYLSRDMYTGALADLNLSTSPWNNNRYALTGGNPITGIELDGHRLTCGDYYIDCQNTRPPVETVIDPADLPGIGRPGSYEPQDPGGSSGGESPATGDNSLGPLLIGAGVAINTVDNSDGLYRMLMADTHSYTLAGGAYATATPPGTHAWEPDHKVNSLVQWGRAANNTLVRGTLRTVPFVSAGISFASNYAGTGSVGHATKAAAAEATVGAAVGGVVGAACLATAGLGCGVAIGLGTAFTAWAAPKASEWVMSQGWANTAAEGIDTGWEATKSFFGSLF